MPTTNPDLSRYDSDHERILAQWGDHDHIAPLGRIRSRFFALVRTPLRWVRSQWESPLAYAIRSEVQGIPDRIRFRLEIAKCHGIELGLAVEEDANGGFVPNKRTYGRIHDMQAVTSTHPWVEEVEQWHFLQGWEMGARWAESKSHSSQMESSRPS